MVESSPLVSMILVKSLEKCPAFSAAVAVTVSGKADPLPSAATGTLSSRGGNFRWEVKLGDIKSAQLTANAKAVIRQINGDQFLLLTRSDQHANYLVMARAQAYLEQPLPSLKLVNKGRPVSETLATKPCTKEHFTASAPDSTALDVLVWKTKDHAPAQIQITDAGELIQIRFKDVHFQTPATEAFQLPPNLSKYTSVEDLVQSVLVDRMKKRFGF